MKTLTHEDVQKRRNGIIAARRRGWSTLKIAQALNISNVTAGLHIKKAYKESGDEALNIKMPRKTLNKARVMTSCVFCKKPIKIMGKSFKKWTAHYCGNDCKGMDQRLTLNSDIIQKTIDMRRANETWIGIVQVLKIPVQIIKRNIWWYLFKQKLLTQETVNELWGAAPITSQPSTLWLQRETGIRPSSSGGEKKASI